MKKTSRGRFAAEYTVLFVLLGALVFAPFALTGTSLVCKVDGQSQYVVYLSYMGEYLRAAWRDLLAGDAALQMYDFRIGMGDDINAVVRFHPLDFLSFFVQPSGTETLYAVILLLRLFLSGAAFAVYAFRCGAEEERDRHSRAFALSVLAGCIVYVFCGFTLIRVTNHPIYASAFEVLPLLLLGAEDAMRGRECWLMPVAVCVGLISNYYFVYISSFALLAFVLLRLDAADLRGAGAAGRRASGGAAGHTGRHTATRTGLRFAGLAARLSGLYLLGTGMAMVTLLPTLQRYLHSARTRQLAETKSLLVWEDKRRYVAWILNLISPLRSSGNGLNLNFTVTVLPAILLLLTAKKNLALKLSLALEASCLLIPAPGWVLAVFNNENSRWVYLLAFSLGLTVTRTAGRVLRAERRERRLLPAAVLLFDAAVLAQHVLAGFNLYNAAGAAALTVYAGAVLALARRGETFGQPGEDRAATRGGAAPAQTDDRPAAACAESRPACDPEERRETRSAAFVLGSTAVCAVLWAWLTYAPSCGNLVSEFADAGTALTSYAELPQSAAADLAGSALARTDAAGVDSGTENAALVLNYYGVSMYNSILNTGILDLLGAQNNIGLDSLTHVQDLDGRPVSELLAGVRWYVAPEGREGSVPYGFSGEPAAVVTVGEGESAQTVSLFENEISLPAGYCSDAWILREDYDALDPLEKEMAMLRGVVLEEAPEDGSLTRLTGDALHTALVTEAVALPEEGKNLTRTADGYRAEKKNAKLTLTYEGREDMVCYLRLSGLVPQAESAKLTVKSDGIEKDVVLRSAAQVYTLGRTQYDVCLGAAGSGTHEVRVIFRSRGAYELEGISLVWVPMDELRERAAVMAEGGLTDAVIGKNTVSGSAAPESETFMTFQIPYAEGWRLTVDGVETEPVRANVLYMGAVLSAGEHRIVLSYETPGLRTGALLSAVSLAVFALVLIRHMPRRAAGRSA